MLRRIFILTAVFIIGLTMLSCNGSSSDSIYGGTNPFLSRLWIGNVEVKSGGTFNVPLSLTNSIRFEVSNEVTPESLGKLLNYRILVRNDENGSVSQFTQSNLKTYGDLIWLDSSNKRLEYRMNRSLISAWFSEAPFATTASRGNRFTVRIDFAVGMRADGRQFSFTGDQFHIVWVDEDLGIINDDNDKFDGSHPILNKMTIGNVTVENKELANVPLSLSNTIRFELNEPVTPQSLGTLLSFTIVIDNLTKGTTFNVTEDILDENGELYWPAFDSKTIEYRMNHNMSYLLAGGQEYYLGTVGDTFQIRVANLQGLKENGNPFTFSGDKFYIVWTNSTGGIN